MTTQKRIATPHPLSQVELDRPQKDQNVWKLCADAVVQAGLRVTRDSTTVELSDFVSALIDEIDDLDFTEAMIRKIDNILALDRR